MQGMRIKKWLLTFLAGSSLLFLTGVLWAADDAPEASAKKVESAGKPLAKVNGVVITSKELDQEIGVMEDQLARMGRPASKEQLNNLKNKLLDQMIAWELFYQEAQKQGIQVTDEEVAENVDSYKAQFGDEQKAKEEMAKMGLSDAEMTKETRKKMVVQRLLEKEVMNKISVSEEEMKAFYDENPQYFEKPEMVRASHILIKVPPDADDATKEEARKKLEVVEQRLKKGEDFAAVAKEVSECPSAKEGGDLGAFSANEMVKPFSDAAFALEPGNVSGIVETKFGYHLIKSTEKIPASKVPFEEVKGKIGEYLKSEKMQKGVQAYSQELMAKADIERYSDKEDPK